MTAILTGTGWTTGQGISIGSWTQDADIVEGSGFFGVFVGSGTVVNTLGGNDSISGDSSSFAGIQNDGIINTGSGDDSITGRGGQVGILNREFSSSINTGNGNDTITGIGSTGIFNSGTIDTGNGNDIITGIGVGVGISNARVSSYITTGNGNDIITGSGGVIGIQNLGTIDTGNGNDIVDALIGGFNGGGTILLGNGDDLIRGSQANFGSGIAQKVDGGRGFDTAELGIDFSLGSLSRPDGFDIAIGRMYYKNVEMFVFNDVQYDLASLQSMV